LGKELKLYRIRFLKTHDTVYKMVVSSKDSDELEEYWSKQMIDEGEYHFGCYATEIDEVDGYKIEIGEKVS